MKFYFILFSLFKVMGMVSQAKYGVYNNKNEQVYYAYESKNLHRRNSFQNIRLESDTCQRMCCPKVRGFDLHIVDSTNQVCQQLCSISFHGIIIFRK